MFCVFLSAVISRREKGKGSGEHTPAKQQQLRRTGWAYLFSFFQIRQHHDGCTFLLPDHSPEVIHCFLLGTWEERMVRIRQSGPCEPQTCHPGLWASDGCFPTTCPEEGGDGPVHSLQSPRTGVGGSLPVWPCLSLPDTRPPRGWEILGG